jgi:hypothetical protein
MNESVLSSGIQGAIPDALEDPGRAIALAPGLNGTVWLYHADRAVHLDHNALRDLLFLRNTAIIYDAGGTVVLSPSGSGGIAIRLPSGLQYIIPRAALAAAARGVTRSRFDPMLSM